MASGQPEMWFVSTFDSYGSWSRDEQQQDLSRELRDALDTIERTHGDIVARTTTILATLRADLSLSRRPFSPTRLRFQSPSSGRNPDMRLTMPRSGASSRTPMKKQARRNAIPSIKSAQACQPGPFYPSSLTRTWANSTTSRRFMGRPMRPRLATKAEPEVAS